MPLRRRRARRLIVAGLLLAVAPLACGPAGSPVQAPSEGPDPRTGMDGEMSLTLAPGQSVTLGEVDPLRVTFQRVVGDSRCPVGVQCVWAGEAEVELRVARAGADTVVTLHGVREPRRVEYGGHVILLAGVTPEPLQGGVDPAAYRATLVVDRK